MENEINTNPGLSIIKNYFIDETGAAKIGGVVVECGTAQGTFNPSLYMEEHLGWTFYGFEPHPAFWEQLNYNRPLPSAIKINKALSSYVGNSDFCMAGDNSSLHHSKAHLQEMGGGNLQHITVETTTWRDFIDEFKIPDVSLFILDVEGCELEVLEGMLGCPVMPSIIMIEYCRSDYDFLLRNEETHEDFSGFKIIKDAVTRMGYMFDYAISANAMFSRNDFWENKERPNTWFGEELSCSLHGYEIYNKEKCQSL